LNNELLTRLLTTPGISGRESRIRDVARAELEGLVDEVRTDPLGNLIGVRNGSGPRVMLAAHMDSIGFMVKYIDDRGFIRLQTIGGFDVRTLVMQRVLVQGKADYVGLLCPSSKPIHLLTPEERERSYKIEDMYVDVLLPAEEVAENVSIGDPISLHREPHYSDRSVTSPYLDDRLGVYVMLEALRAARETQCEIHAVVTVQEEVGLRGAGTSAHAIRPDIGVALDVTIAGDVAGADKSQWVAPLGGGTAISVMDADSISDPRLVAKCKELAERHGIKAQLEVRGRGGTDAGAIVLAGAGARAITISMPVRYIHSVNETALVEDIDASVALTARFLEAAHEVDLEW